MNIVLVSTENMRGGAPKATHRLHEGLRKSGQNCRTLVRHQHGNVPGIDGVVSPDALGSSPDALFLDLALPQHHLDPQRTSVSNSSFSLPYPGFDLTMLPQVEDADVINLHWVSHFQSPPTIAKLLALDKPVVWTLHDQWPFTGGCHYTAGCTAYRRDCTHCPQLGEAAQPLAAAGLQDRASYLDHDALTLVAPSHWMADCARESRLFRNRRIEVIPNSIDTDLYRPVPKAEAKRHLGLPPEAITLLFGAYDAAETRKGFSVLLDAMKLCMATPRFRQLSKETPIHILSLGTAAPPPAEIGFPIRALGYLESDSDLCMAYSAADIFVLPSLEDNLPNTLLEAMSCATPVIGSRAGGIPDVIVAGETGFLVDPGNAPALAETILSSVSDPRRLHEMGQRCRRTMEQSYGLRVQAARYLALFTELAHNRETAAPRPAGPPMPAERASSQAAPPDSEMGTAFRNVYSAVMPEVLHGFGASVFSHWQKSEKDRAARMEIITGQAGRLGELAAERQCLLDQLNQLRAQVAAADADCAAKLRTIENQARLVSALSTYKTSVERHLFIRLLRRLNLLRSVRAPQ